jgi:hypothetical protein
MGRVGSAGHDRGGVKGRSAIRSVERKGGSSQESIALRNQSNEVRMSARRTVEDLLVQFLEMRSGKRCHMPSRPPQDPAVGTDPSQMYSARSLRLPQSLDNRCQTDARTAWESL